MAAIIWDRVGGRFFETGLDKGVLYPSVGSGVPWNGLVSVNHTPSGGEPKARYVDGYKYQNRSAPDEYEATIEAYTYPDQFEDCAGLVAIGNGLSMGFQRRKSFGLSYRTKIGNDVDGPDYGHKIHIAYNVLAAPSNQNYQTAGDNPEAISFNWSVTSKAVKASGRRATPYMVIDTRKTPAPLLVDIESILYGTSSTEPRLPTPTELVAMFVDAPSLFVIDNGNGTFTVSGPDALVRLLDERRFQFDATTVVDNGDGTFTITSF